MLPRLSQAIAITALLYLVAGMSNPDAVSGSSNPTVQPTTSTRPALAQQHSSPKQLAEVVDFNFGQSK